MVANNLYDLVANQIQEMELVRSKIFQLEQTHMQMKQKYVVPEFLQEQCTNMFAQIRGRH